MADVVNPPAAGRSFGRTQRHDTWWVEIVPVVVLLGGFGFYATLRAFEGRFYEWGPYLSPFYSPLIDPHHHWWLLSPAMQILQDEGKCRLAAIRSAALADHTGRGVEKERAIIGLPVVVAGHAESQRAAQNQQRGRKQPPMVMGVDQRRIKRGEVWPPFVETALKGPQSGVKAEPPQQHNNRNNLDPPGIVPLGSTEAAPGGRRIHNIGHVHPLAPA